MNTLKIVNPYLDVLVGYPQLDEMAIQYPYDLDGFQKHAICAIHAEENVLVTAKTGSGKTLVGEYQIAYSLRKGGRVFYTTPIKSLSNQKFHDLKGMFPSVGIVTGDIKFQPDAQVVIMTTECLRNMLYKKGSSTESLGLTAGMSLTGLDAVIFDEVHYINNKERGKVWEETMILLPSDVKMILLSATIDGADLFAGWLGSLKNRRTWLIPTHHRVVPLKHCVITDLAKEPTVIMNSADRFDGTVYDKWLVSRKRICDEYELHRRRVGDRKRGGYEEPVVKQAIEDRPVSYVAELNRTARYLQDRNLLPALFFVFSRGSCEKYATAMEGTYIDSSDSASVRHVIRFHLHKYDDVLQGLKQYHDIVALLERGIAYHHSGLLPILKEIVEILFSKGLVKVMFCTETFAVGINMPTRTVVFMDLRKYCDTLSSLRALEKDEYIQMAGRAGRRGKDREGLILYLPHRDPVSTSELRQMMCGSGRRIQSRMDFHYDFILKSIQSGSINTNWLRIGHDSFFWKQHLSSVKENEKVIAELKEKITKIQITEQQMSDLDEGKRLILLAKTSVNAERKKVQVDVEKWKNKHMGPVWLLLQKRYDELVVTRIEIEKETKQLEDMNNFMRGPANNINFLQEIGFLKDVEFGKEDLISQGNLTLKGILATEVNEANPILLVTAYTEELFSELEASDILLVLAGFCKEKGQGPKPQLNSVHISVKAKETLCKIQEIGSRFLNNSMDSEEYWNLNTFWLEPVADWLDGKVAKEICSNYGIYEGNLYRTLMSLNNLLNEITSLATYCEHIDVLARLQQLKENGTLLRDIVINDSLYLR
jgi:superfamily II RNA helicase